MLRLEVIKRTDPRLVENMKNHYSNPKGFVGRNICFAILWNNVYYGSIVAGSATLHLPNRNNFFGIEKKDLTKIANNIFFHIEKIENKYPCRNFAAKVLSKFEYLIPIYWKNKYGDILIGLESLVELPRTGEVYIRNDWTLIGQTKGFTCKRTSGKGTDSWTGKRVWNTKELKPKLVFCKKIVSNLQS